MAVEETAHVTPVAHFVFSKETKEKLSVGGIGIIQLLPLRKVSDQKVDCLFDVYGNVKVVFPDGQTGPKSAAF